jgi:glutamate 5-kinase
MSLTIVGALTGGMMTRPTAAQLAAARAGERMTIAGAHTVGAPDGGPGLSGTGWSTDHGDLRVPHFFGLHALQVLPLVSLLLARGRFRPNARVRLTLVAAASYAALYLILVLQALRGSPLVAPDATTIAQLGVWALATAGAAGLALLDRDAARQTLNFEL